MRRFLIVLCSAMILGAMPIYAQNDGAKQELSVSYGVVTNNNMGNLFMELITLSFAEVDLRFSGAANIDYLHRLSNTVWLGASGSYEFGREPRDAKFESRHHYITLMPTAKFFWFHRDKFAMYSRLAVGCTYIHGRSDGERDQLFIPAFQLSPIALEAGGKVRYFLELGLGTQGIALTGVRFRF